MSCIARSTSLCEQNKQRKDWADALRALAMFFVIFGHLLGWIPIYFIVTSPIKIPLFFVITGYVFNYRRTDTSVFFKNIFRKLVVPWLCLTIPFVFLKVPEFGFSVIPREIDYILSGVVIWYMPCCIIAEIIWFFIAKNGRTPLCIAVMALLVFAMGVVAAQLGVLDFAMISRAMIVQFFILCGFLMKLWEDKWSRINWPGVFLLIAVYAGFVLISTVLWPNQCLDVHVNRYYNYPFCFAMIVLGCFVLFAASRKFFEDERHHVPALISFFGQNTLVFYLLHNRNIQLISALLARFSIPPALLLIIKLVLTYVMCSLEALLINRFLPGLLGKKKRSPFPDGRLNC